MQKRRVAYGLSCIAVAMIVGALMIAPAAAQTTATTAASPASYPLLGVDDLPNGYETDPGMPGRRSGSSAVYPTVKDCVFNETNRMSGLTPELYYTGFTSKSGIGSGQETVWEFADPKAASTLYKYLEDAFTAGTKCKVVKQMGTASPTTLTDMGTFTALKIGSVGDDSTAITLDPPSRPTDSRYAFVLAGNRVAAMRVTDKKVTKQQFSALVETAAARIASP